MKTEIKTKFYLDSRRKNAKGTYPVKLRLYEPRTTKERLFRTGLDLSENEFEQVYLKKEAQKLKDKLTKDKRETIETILKAIDTKGSLILKELKEFSFKEFERRFYNKASRLDLCDYYEEYIQKLKEEGSIRTADTYFYSLKKLKEYLKYKTKKEPSEIPFESITISTLKAFEKYCLDEKGHTKASIGIYLRPLRSIFNTAIADPNSGLKQEIYPFGVKKYTIPTGQNIKKALSNYQLKTLFELEPENEFQKKAKAFWFFSYLANGMNFKDIADLKFENLKHNIIVFERSKTKNTTKTNPISITAILPEYALNIIKEYGNDSNIKKDYIFNIIKKTDQPEKAISKLTAFTRFTNQHIKNLVKQYNDNLIKNTEGEVDESKLLPEEISTYWARHSFTTQAMRKGARMELVQESLGHKNLATTQNYFKGFAFEVKEELSKTLLDF